MANEFVQQTYDINTGNAYAGLIADTSYDTRIGSFQNRDTVNIDFGLAVVRDTAIADNAAVLPSAASQSFLGITVRDIARENLPPIGSGVTGYKVGDMMNVMRSDGRIWVLVEDAVVAGGGVFFRHTAPGVEQLGAFRSDADGGNADQVTNAVFDTSAGAGELAIVLLGNT